MLHPLEKPLRIRREDFRRRVHPRQARSRAAPAPRPAGQGGTAGQVLAAPEHWAAFERAHQALGEFVTRHVSGECGEVHEEDRTENEGSLLNGYRILRP
jgi:hypothetical protein